MNVLLLGSGAREHALAWKLSASESCEHLFCAPGNAGIESVAECVDLDAGGWRAISSFCRAEGIELVVPGSETLLAAGLADRLEAEGIPVFGPSAEAARLEASKGFAREVCRKAKIPSPEFAIFRDANQAKDYIRKKGAPIVVKADGLAAGKGVVVAESEEKAFEAVDACFSGRFGEAGAQVVLEECLQGEEASLFAICDGETALPFASARDYKRAFDGNKGPNTGGMGAISPSPNIDERKLEELTSLFASPVLGEMRKRGIPFRGILYAGLMFTKEGPKLIEYNVRFGDPECQALMPRLDSDLVSLMVSARRGELKKTPPIRWSDQRSATVVMASHGYPGAHDSGTVISGVERAEGMGALVFHASTARREGDLIAAGGRTLSVTALGADAQEARRKAYEAVEAIEWKEGFFRSDIGAEGIPSGGAERIGRAA